MRPAAAIALLCLYATPSAAFLGPALHRPAVLLRPHAPLPAAAAQRRAAPPLALEAQEEAMQQQHQVMASAEQARQMPPVRPDQNVWAGATDSEGREYYYNLATHAVSWQLPHG